MSRKASSDTLQASIITQQGKLKQVPSTSNGRRWAPWLRVLATFLIYVSTWGLLNAFGSYQFYYAENLLSGESSSNLAWPGTIQAVLIILVGVITGPLFDRGYIRSILIIGSSLVIIGMMMTSLSTKYYQIVLAQGVCVGVGSGMVYVPSLAMVGSSFKAETRMIPIAIATSGAALGGIIFPLALQKLLPLVGFPWATRIIAFIALFCFAMALAIVLPRTQESIMAKKQGRSLIDWSAFREPAFVFFCCALFLMFTAYYVPFFFIPEFASRKLNASTDLSVYFLVITNAATAPGRIFFAFLASRFGNTKVLVAAVFCVTVLLWAWLAVDSLPGFVAWTVLFGFCAGPLVTIPAGVCAQLCPSTDIYGTRLGMAWAFAAMGGLVGAPVAGAIIEGSIYYHAQIFTGCFMTAGLLCLVQMWISI